MSYQTILEMPVGTPQERIAKALAIAVAWGGYDGGHHKAWTIDQMVRALTGCPLKKKFVDGPQPYAFDAQGESEEYMKVVAEACAGEDGPNTYRWDVGIPA